MLLPLWPAVESLKQDVKDLAKQVADAEAALAAEQQVSTGE